MQKLIFITLLYISGLNLLAKNPSDSLVQHSHNGNSSSMTPQYEIFTFEGSYTGDLLMNLRGGVKTGATYMGMGNLRITLNLEQAGLWRGSEIFINGAVTHGSSPSENIIGDFQVASNIDAGNRSYIHELWFRQQFSPFQFTAGLQDLNVDFVNTESGSNFMNSSFGVPSVISANMPAPIFPLTSLGFTAKFNAGKGFALQAAIFDGNPTSYDKNIYNTRWELKKEDGALIIGEVQYEFSISDKPGSIKAGYYYHTGLNEFDDETSEYYQIFHHNSGSYILADLNLWSASSASVRGFMQLAISPGHLHNYYIGGGLVCSNSIFSNDLAGLAVAHAGFDEGYGSETAFELFYRLPITDKFFIQPDLQYIVNPFGNEILKRDAVALFIKTAINF